jgi:predicted transcriptional regulator of viral defense system
MPSSLEKARRKIRARLDSETGGVLTEARLRGLLLEHEEEWGLDASVALSEFTSFLVEKLGLRRIELRSERYGHKVRYGWGEFSPYLMALSLRPRSYLSHGTAVFLHALNEQLPKTIYVNQEQSEKPAGGELSQDRLALAFARRQRTSGYVYSLDRFRVVLLSGKHTGDLGVEKVKGPAGEELPTTGVARTLVDIVVRPAYAGGMVQVLEAYREANGRVNASELVRTLRRLNYVYPYHQAIGFLMERAGYPREEHEKLRRLGAKFDFYLLHGMRKSRYDPKWRLFFPQGL